MDERPAETEEPDGWQLCVEHEDPRIVVAIAHSVASHVVGLLPVGAVVGVDGSDAEHGKAYVCVPNEPPGLLNDSLLTAAFEGGLARSTHDCQLVVAWEELVGRMAAVEAMIEQGARVEDVASYMGERMVPAVRKALPPAAVAAVKLTRLDPNIFFVTLASTLARHEREQEKSVN